jgi:acetyl-CoA acetyltransferase
MRDAVIIDAIRTPIGKGNPVALEEMLQPTGEEPVRVRLVSRHPLPPDTRTLLPAS